MAEAVLFNAAKSLLQQLSSPLQNEFLLLWTSKIELNRLQNTISTIKDVLQDAEQKQATDDAVKTWLGRLRDEMYKADDLFDLISTRALQKRAMSGNKITREVRLFFSKSNQLVMLVSTAHRVKELRGSLDEVSDDIRRFDFLRSKIEAPKPIVSRHEEHSYVNKDEIIGRDEEKKSIVNMLKSDSDGAHVSVIAVIGFGGSGKTALAQLVYNELKQVPGQFELCLWACVNDFSNLNVVLEKILACGTKDKIKDFQLEQLQEMLREKILGKKYLLVLDDVWEVNIGSWDRFKRLLNVGNIGTKVLVTTRSEVVAKRLSAAKPCHHLGGLSDEDAWSLFKNFAFYPNELEKIHRMEKTGKDIVRRCGNVPLALRTVGSFLRDRDENSWSNALSDEISGDVMEVLKVSYDDLPSSLKHCFAYCSLFPKDFEFDKDELIRFWMAQGFLEVSGNEKSLEKVGEENFYYLLQRCFFQDVEKNDEGQVVSCKMHDLLHDLAIRVAGRDCSMVEDIGDDFNGTLLHVSCKRDADQLKEIPPSLLNMKGLRSLILHNLSRDSDRLFVRQLFAFKSLRVLDLSFLEMEVLPSSIGNLVHLRYLDLSWNEVLIKLPDSICKLQNLLTLDVRGCCRVKKLPVDLKLLCLRHLEIDECDDLTCMPSGLKKMTSLVSLGMLVVNTASGGLRYLRDLDSLRGFLKIKLPGDGWKNSVADAKESMLRNKTGLAQLFIEWNDAEDSDRDEEEAKKMLNSDKDAGKMHDSDEVLDHLEPSQNLQRLKLSGFPGTRMSVWVNSLENLKRLTLKGCTRCHQLPPLWKLHFLKKLSLKEMPLVEYIENDICPDMKSFFPSLFELIISDMPKLKGWWRQTTHVGRQLHVNLEESAHEPLLPFTQRPWFPRLSDLQVISCPELTDLPLFPSIEKLILDGVKEKLLRDAVLRAPDYSELTSSSANDTCFRLRKLRIARISNLVSLPEEWSTHLSTLSSLRIESCPKLRSLPHNMLQRLTSLEKLLISGCKELILLKDEDQEEDETPLIVLKRLKRLGISVDDINLLKGLHHLSVLQDLVISGQGSSRDAAPVRWAPPPNLESLTVAEVHHLDLSQIPWEVLVHLRRLTLRDIKGMKVMPEMCQYLSALQELEIDSCTELESLPSWISRLQRIEVSECPILKTKYERPSCPCWHLIKDIPDIDFD